MFYLNAKSTSLNDTKNYNDQKIQGYLIILILSLHYFLQLIDPINIYIYTSLILYKSYLLCEIMFSHLTAQQNTTI